MAIGPSPFADSIQLRCRIPANIAKVIGKRSLRQSCSGDDLDVLREIEVLCKEIPHADLCIQWDYCIEMLQFDGWTGLPAPKDMVRAFSERLERISPIIPAEVELDFHHCYGDLDGKHYIEPRDSSKMVELAKLILDRTPRRVNYIHMPVPISRKDEEFYAPLKELKGHPATEFYLGLVHAADGVEGTRKRMEIARKYLPGFGIASESGMARGRLDQGCRPRPCLEGPPANRQGKKHSASGRGRGRKPQVPAHDQEPAPSLTVGGADDCRRSAAT